MMQMLREIQAQGIEDLHRDHQRSPAARVWIQVSDSDLFSLSSSRPQSPGRQKLRSGTYIMISHFKGPPHLPAQNDSILPSAAAGGHTGLETYPPSPRKAKKCSILLRGSAYMFFQPGMKTKSILRDQIQ
ncbi:uncharacterized protein LOC144282485 isoform X2 [Canis aureus]